MSFQTIAAPVLTALLYLLIFSHVLESRVAVFDGRVAYTAFLIPGPRDDVGAAERVRQRSSSLIQSKITGNLIFVLLPPLSPLDMFAAYVLGAMVRGLVVGSACSSSRCCWFRAVGDCASAVGAGVRLLGSAILGTLGVIAGIWADKFDQLAAFQNFLIMPLTFLSGVFYSIHSLPPFWQALSHFNPFFYMIDGFRYGFFGLSDVAPVLSLALVAAAAVILAALALLMLARGWKLRH